ncbi:MAG TPA: hypothetical protein VKX49_20410 [Bryobacteraceae bacterium]|nr:hypothetical protein [Bryobacteraceae bacterium]
MLVFLAAESALASGGFPAEYGQWVHVKHDRNGHSVRKGQGFIFEPISRLRGQDNEGI